MRGPETRLRKKIVAAILAEYPRAYVRKVHGGPMQNIGIADLLCCICGYFFALEIKVPGRKGATKAQLLEGRKVLNARGIFGVVVSVEDALRLIERGLEWHRGREIETRPEK